MTNKTLKNESGMASIMFAMFIVIVVTLIAVGFAVLVRNDQRQTLDKTLSNQAIYAAESAINKKQRDLVNGVGTADNLTNCAADPLVSGGVLDSQLPGVSITCLTWDKTPENLTFQNIGSNPAVARIEGTSAIQSLEITWDKQGATTFMGSTSQLILGTMPTLRITIASENDINTVNTVYVNPHQGGSDLTLSSSGLIGDSISCNINSCTALINGMHWNSGGLGWGWISISSLNGTSDNIRITAYASPNGPPSNSIAIVGAQAEIDATAKSQDVIKRLKARVSLTENTWRPNFVASADRLCKNYKLDANTNMVAGPVSTTFCP